jgi:hypothetical protein
MSIQGKKMKFISITGEFPQRLIFDYGMKGAEFTGKYLALEKTQKEHCR